MEILIDSFDMSDFLNIKASCIIDSIDKDFVIDRAEFEYFCDKEELRQWDYSEWDAEKGYFHEWSYILEWHEIYDSFDHMYKFLKMYIQNLYDMESLNIESPLKKILL